jgi:hypothetical protein
MLVSTERGFLPRLPRRLSAVGGPTKTEFRHYQHNRNPRLGRHFVVEFLWDSDAGW